MALTVKFPRGADVFAALTPSDYVDARALTSGGGAESLTVPTGALYAVFSCTGNFYAAYDGTAAVPSDVSDGRASELNPTIRKLLNASGAVFKTISVITPDSSAVVTVSYFKASA